MKKLFTFFAGMLIVSSSVAEEHLTATAEDLAARKFYEPLEIDDSCFNRDVIAERVVTIEDCSYPTITNEVVTSYYVTNAQLASSQEMYNAQPISYSFATESVVGTIAGSTFAYSGFPDDGHVECITDSIPGLYWQLAPYNGHNALCVREGITKTGKFTFKNVGCYQHLYFLVAATGSGVVEDQRYMRAIAYYSDGTNDTTRFKFYDHADVGKNEAYYNRYAACHDNFGNYSVVKADATGYCTFIFKNNRKNADGTIAKVDTTHRFNYYNRSCYAVVCEMPINQHKLLESVEFTGAGDDKCGLVIFAVTGKTAEVAAPDANPAPHSRAPMRTSNITSESFDVEWDAVAGADSYRLDVATDEDFHHMVGIYNNMTVNGTSAHVDGLDDENEHEYYWRVRSVDASGGQSASSAPRKTVLVGGTAPSTHEEGKTIEADLQELINVAVPSITITRTLYKDGDFNTLCLPFDLSASALATSPIAGCELYEFVGAKVLGSSRLDIEMRKTDNLVAGVPYLLKWANTGEKLTELIFYNVTITKSKGDTIVGVNDEERTALVRFIGNLDQQHLGINNKNYLFLGASNTLYWPNTDNNMYGFRAYFDIPSLLSSPAASPVRQGMPARIVLQEQVATGVENTSAKFGGSEKHLENGQLVIIRDGIRYNVMGLQLR